MALTDPVRDEIAGILYRENAAFTEYGARLLADVVVAELGLLPNFAYADCGRVVRIVTPWRAE